MRKNVELSKGDKTVYLNRVGVFWKETQQSICIRLPGESVRTIRRKPAIADTVSSSTRSLRYCESAADQHHLSTIQKAKTARGRRRDRAERGGGARGLETDPSRIECIARPG